MVSNIAVDNARKIVIVLDHGVLDFSALVGTATFFFTVFRCERLMTAMARGVELLAIREGRAIGMVLSVHCV